MLFAVCVPSFATELTGKPNDSGSADIYTVTTDDDETYTVTIPADTAITWGATSTALKGYSVESHLTEGKYLTISVTGTNKMVLSTDENETLAYTLEGDTSYTATGPVINPAADLTLKVNITDDDWDNAIVGEYRDTLTFSVTVNETTSD